MLILASASKPRSCLLKKTGISHDVIISDIDEDSYKEDSILKLVERLSFAKADCVAKKIISLPSSKTDYSSISAVLACDSLFEFEGEYFGKPKSPDEAFERWRKLSNSSGNIVTGHCLMYRDRNTYKNKDINFDRIIRENITTKIYFNKLTDKDIWDYIATKEPMSCAGGFSLEGVGGMFIKKIEGCYSNVIGLSLPWLRNALIDINLFKKITLGNI